MKLRVRNLYNRDRLRNILVSLIVESGGAVTTYEARAYVSPNSHTFNRFMRETKDIFNITECKTAGSRGELAHMISLKEHVDYHKHMIPLPIPALAKERLDALVDYMTECDETMHIEDIAKMFEVSNTIIRQRLMPFITRDARFAVTRDIVRERDVKGKSQPIKKHLISLKHQLPIEPVIEPVVTSLLDIYTTPYKTWCTSNSSEVELDTSTPDPIPKSTPTSQPLLDYPFHKHGHPYQLDRLYNRMKETRTEKISMAGAARLIGVSKTMIHRLKPMLKNDDRFKFENTTMRLVISC